MLTFAQWSHNTPDDDLPYGLELPQGIRVRWIYDDLYEPDYAYDTEEETEGAIREEHKALESGSLVALACIVEDAVTGETLDALHGIVVEPHEEELVEFFKGNMEIPTEVEVATKRHAQALEALKRAHELLVEAHVREAQAKK